MAFQKVVRYCSAVVLICGGSRVSDMSEDGVSLGIVIPIHAFCQKALVSCRTSFIGLESLEPMILAVHLGDKIVVMLLMFLKLFPVW